MKDDLTENSITISAPGLLGPGSRSFGVLRVRSARTAERAEVTQLLRVPRAHRFTGGNQPLGVVNPERVKVRARPRARWIRRLL